MKGVRFRRIDGSYEFLGRAAAKRLVASGRAVWERENVIREQTLPRWSDISRGFRMNGSAVNRVLRGKPINTGSVMRHDRRTITTTA